MKISDMEAEQLKNIINEVERIKFALTELLKKAEID